MSKPYDRLCSFLRDNPKFFSASFLNTSLGVDWNSLKKYLDILILENKVTEIDTNSGKFYRWVDESSSCRA